MKRKYHIGQKLIWHYEEFDGSGDVPCIVTEVHDDHAIAESDGMHLWIDDDMEYMFRNAE
jgi:hypothetical protein